MDSDASLSTPSSEPSPIEALSDPHWWQAFGQHLWQHFRTDRSFESAAALTYTSLLALVPLMAVIIGVLSAFPVFDYGVERLQDFIFSNFVPAASDVIRDYLDQFVARSGQLTGAGTLFLLVTAIVLMSTIERSLNRIWRVDKPRRPASRLLVYWSVLTLGPLLLGASLGLTSYLAALPLMTPEFVRGWIQSGLLLFTPFVVALAAFFLIFLVVPNRHVRWNHALAGAAFSALAFEVSKRGFVFYIQNFPTYERLYGALATIPIFLIWIFVTWVVILLGASLAASLTTFNYRRADWRWDPRHHLVLTVRLLGHLWQAQRSGQGRSGRQLRELEEAATDDEIQRLLDGLDDAGFVQQDDGGKWFLCSDLDERTLGDVYRSMPLVLPVGELHRLPAEDPRDRRLRDALQRIGETAEPVFDTPVKRLLTRDARDGETIHPSGSKEEAS
ncbi:MAG: YihY family inner membrane protein [Wenzhouxiangellaceae bacterium]|nr:YihY family inner membrane protein [Wenzhouxiangellaceae bacterium]